MSQPEEEILFGDFNHAKSVALALLKVKMHVWETLPWIFCGLAHGYEDVAKGIARRIFGIVE